jgi:hypothetical protein
MTIGRDPPRVVASDINQSLRNLLGHRIRAQSEVYFQICCIFQMRRRSHNASNAALH